MKITELENKRQIRCLLSASQMKEEEVLLQPDKNGVVYDLLREAQRHLAAASSSPSVNIELRSVS